MYEESQWNRNGGEIGISFSAFENAQMLKLQEDAGRNLKSKNHYLKKRKSASHLLFQAVCSTGSNMEPHHFFVPL